MLSLYASDWFSRYIYFLYAEGLVLLRRFRFVALRPGAFGSPFLGEFSFAAFTNSSKRFLGTAMTLRITFLKCLNSGVLSNSFDSITSYWQLVVMCLNPLVQTQFLLEIAGGYPCAL